jgi:carbonic anhydrase
MEKIISYDTLKGSYVADACIVWCFDDRFTGLLREFTKGMENFDLVKVAGGAKALAEGPSPARDFLTDQVAVSIRLHGAKKVMLMLHEDCGAYGGSKRFADGETEQNFYISQLALARDFLREKTGAVPVETYYGTFDALYRTA